MTTRRTPLLLGMGLLLFLGFTPNTNAGIFRFTPQDYAYGPYRGGHHYGYATSYHYLLPFSSSHYPDPWNFPYSFGYYPEAYFWANRHTPARWMKRWHYQEHADLSVPDDAEMLSLEPAPVLPSGPAIIEVTVPPQAEIWIDGHKTKQSGALRRFQTPPLTGKEVFPYEFRVRWQEGEHVQEQTRTIFIHAGARPHLVFP
jgi:uncharacterized protein (TIGR03000 family)